VRLGPLSYSARWKHVHLPTVFGDLGPELPADAGPLGSDIWVDTA